MKLFLTTSLLFATTFMLAQAPSWDWALGAGGTMNASGLKVAVDPLGNVYQTGYYSSPTITFGDSTLVHALPPNTERIFLAKYDPQGELLWVRQPGGYTSGEGLCVAADDSGNVVIGGYFQGDQIGFGTVPLNGSSVDNDLFVVKYDADGDALWGLSAGGMLGTAPEFVTDVCTDADGNVLFTGYSSSDDLIIGGVTLSNPGPNQSFLVKLDPMGTALWVRGCYGTCSHQSTSVAVDPAGNAYLSGWFFNSPLTYDGVATATASGYDGYLFKFTPDGDALWAKNIAGIADEEIKDITADGTGHIYAVGTTESPLVHFDGLQVNDPGISSSFIARYDTAGTVEWARVLSDTTWIWDVSCDDLGNSFIAGSFRSDAIIIDDDTLLNAGMHNTYVAAYDATGAAQWTAQVEGGWVVCQGIAANDSGDVYLSGYFSNGNALCGTIPVVQAVPGSIGNVLLAKLHAPVIATEVTASERTREMLYPNPTAGRLSVVEPAFANSTFTVLDAAGHVALTGTLHSGTVDVRSLEPGLYILRCVRNGHLAWMTFVRE
ncbi:MAG: T9SS type A sorting domain-containing protein [Flavobacteriales bacterium]